MAHLLLLVHRAETSGGGGRGAAAGVWHVIWQLAALLSHAGLQAGSHVGVGAHVHWLLLRRRDERGFTFLDCGLGSRVVQRECDGALSTFNQHSCFAILSEFCMCLQNLVPLPGFGCGD